MCKSAPLPDPEFWHGVADQAKIRGWAALQTVRAGAKFIWTFLDNAAPLTIPLLMISLYFTISDHNINSRNDTARAETQKTHEQLGSFINEGQDIIDHIEHSDLPYAKIKVAANDWNARLEKVVYDRLGDLYVNRMRNEVGLGFSNPRFLFGKMKQNKIAGFS